MSRRKEFFPEVTDQQWNDWHWQVKNRIETVDELKKYIKLTAEEEEGIRESLKTLRMAITPYYLTLIDPENPHCPIRKQAIPTVEELKRSPADLEDPLHEDSDSPVPGLTHRYPDRVLFLITDMCSMYCRHCTRRRFAGQHDCATPEKQIDDCIDYIARTPQVRDVLLSGGGGKIPVMPNYVISQAPNRVVLRNYEGVITTYTEPTDYKDECHCEECEKARRKEGVAELLSGGRLSLEPSELSRKTRNHNH